MLRFLDHSERLQYKRRFFINRFNKHHTLVDTVEKTGQRVDDFLDYKLHCEPGLVDLNEDPGDVHAAGMDLDLAARSLQDKLDPGRNNDLL